MPLSVRNEVHHNMGRASLENGAGGLTLKHGDGLAKLFLDQQLPDEGGPGNLLASDSGSCRHRTASCSTVGFGRC